MELTRENVRVMIYYDFRYGLTQPYCTERLDSAFEDEPPSKTGTYQKIKMCLCFAAG